VKNLKRGRRSQSLLGAEKKKERGDFLAGRRGNLFTPGWGAHSANERPSPQYKRTSRVEQYEYKKQRLTHGNARISRQTLIEWVKGEKSYRKN